MQQIDIGDGSFDIRDWKKLGGDWRKKLDAERQRIRSNFDTKHYEREDLAWYRSALCERFVFLYDTSIYDRTTGRFRVEEFLDQGEQQLGGIDLVLLWHSYPRLGLDRRNQFDFLREMPGGLRGLRDVVDRFHRRGTRVLFPYMPWDAETRREPKSEVLTFAELAGELDVDGLCLDTMNAATPEMRETVDRVKPGLIFSPEYIPPTLKEAEICTGSNLAFERRLNYIPDRWWSSIWHKPEQLTQNVLIIKWLEPRYSIRGNMGHYPVYQYQCPAIACDFFHGMGHQVIENLFGWWTPYSQEAKDLVRKATFLLKRHIDAFTDPDWQPYVDTLAENVFAHRWQAGEKTVYTLFNNNGFSVAGSILEVPLKKGDVVYNAWDGLKLHVARDREDAHVIRTSINALSAGCFIVQPETMQAPEVPPQPSSEQPEDTHLNDSRAHLPRVPERSSAQPLCGDEESMLAVPGGEFLMKLQVCLSAPEGGCYSFPDRPVHPDRLVTISPFRIDRTEVTNAEYRRFLEESHYVPKDTTRFLAHWSGRDAAPTEPWRWSIPEGGEKHPVTYLDIEDARAYARWMGKRLPTEEEWQYAAQGHDDRIWPWGNEYDPAKCNGVDGTPGWNKDIVGHQAEIEPVDAHPAGASPFGCLDMCGNVWEMTESERDDGHTHYMILKGGSSMRFGGTVWYLPGGAQPCARHLKMVLMYPGLDRCETVGFRCVKDGVA